jgi:hypothetical protein
MVTRLGNFLPIRLLSCDFFIKRNSPKMTTPWATNLLHFPANNQFKNMVCILELFGLATIFWLLFQKLGEFFQSSGHPGPKRAMFSFCTKDLYGRMYVALGIE